MKLFKLINYTQAAIVSANSAMEIFKKIGGIEWIATNLDVETQYDIVVTMQKSDFGFFPDRELDQLNDQITDTMIDNVRFIRASEIDRILASELETDPHDNGPHGDVYGYHFAGYDGVSRKCKINGINFYFFVD